MTRLKDKVIDWAYFIVIPMALILVMFISFAQYRSGIQRDEQIASLHRQIAENKELAEQSKTLAEILKMSTDEINAHIDCVLDFLSMPNRASITLDDIPSCKFRKESISQTQTSNGAAQRTQLNQNQIVPVVPSSSSQDNTPQQGNQLDNSQPNNPTEPNVIERLQNALKELPLLGRLF